MGAQAQDRIIDTTSFLFGKLGQLVSRRFAEQLAPLALRPRHLGILEHLTNGVQSQLELARALGTMPSVIVDMLDELEAIDAVRRERDANDRRRQVVALTPAGKSLRKKALLLAKALDEELLTPLSAREREALSGLLSRVATSAQLFTDKLPEP